MSHTPGPWRLTTNTYDEGRPIIEMGSVTRRRVLYLTSADDLPDEYDAEAEANARLIASAPDLLGACIALLRFNEELCQDVGVSTHYPSAEKARAAIARATGGTS